MRSGNRKTRLTLGQIGRLARITVLAAQGRDRALRRELASCRDVPQTLVREALLQLLLFAGYPRTIDALFACHETLGPAGGLSASGGSVASRRKAGGRLCRRIYGRDFVPLLRNMDRLHPALAEGILEEGYGRVLSRPALTPRERELLLVPLLAAMGARRQLSGHVKGALRVGASKRELQFVLRESARIGRR